MHCFIFKFEKVFRFLYGSVFWIWNVSNNLTHRVIFNIIVSNRISQFCIYYNIQEIGIDFCVQAKMIP